MSRLAEFAGSWCVALRIARRSAWRHRGRSALILLMMFVPAYAATILAMAWTNLASDAQYLKFLYGQADLSVTTGDRTAALLPPGSRTVPLIQNRTVVRGQAGLGACEYEATDLTDPLNHGRYVLRAGRAPQAATEVAVTSALAEELGVRPGDQIEAGVPLRRLTVVGVVDWSRSLRLAGLLAPVDAPLSVRPRVGFLVDLPPGHSGDIPGVRWTDPEIAQANATQQGLVAAAAGIVVGFAGAQVVLLAAAAFLVGASRQRRDLALVAAAGATARQLSRIVLAAGLLLGAGAAVAGSVLGVLTFLVVGPLLERLIDHPILEVSIPYGSVAGVLALTMVAGVLAAMVPARIMRRQPLRHGLGGQRSRSRLDVAALVCGLVLLAFGAAALIQSAYPDGPVGLLAFGAVAELMGVVACVPALLRGAGRFAGALPLAGRIALRHAARHRLRTGAAMAATIAAIAGSVALAFVGAAQGEVQPSNAYARDGQVLLPAETAELLGPDHLRDFAAALPARQTVLLQADVTARVHSPIDHFGASGQQRAVAVGGAEIIQLVTGRTATAIELTTLADGGAVAFNDTLVVNDKIFLSVGTVPAPPVPAVRAAHGEYFQALPGLVVSTETAQRLGLTVQPRHLIIDTHRRPTASELAAANDVLLRVQATASAPPAELITAVVTKAEGAPGSPMSMFYLLAVISALVTVAATAVAIGLATVELRGDLATMVAVGATPRRRRRMIAMQAAIIVGAGAVLGLLAGIGPAAGYVGYSTELRWHTPWLALLLIVALPAMLATSLSGLLARGALPLNRRDS